MGRVHKKKIAQYKDSENAETDANAPSGSKDESGRKNNVSVPDNEPERNSDADGEGDIPLNSNAPLDSKKNSGGNEQFSEHEDDSDIDGGETDAEEEKPLVSKNGKRPAIKRKPTSKKSKNEDDSNDELDPIEKNGISPPKRGRAPNKKGTTGKRGRKPKVIPTPNKVEQHDDDDDEEEIDNLQDEEIDEDEEYEVKDIVGHKVEKGVNFYLIRWKGYTKDDDTWESEETLSCQDLIDKYNKKHNNSIPSESNKGRKKKAASSMEEKKRKGRTPAEDPDKEWEVDKIIDYVEEKQGRVFRIRWKGFGPKFDTWEPEANLSCGDLIQKFMKKIDSQKDVSFKQLRRTPKKTKRLVNETAVLPKELNARKSKRGAGKKRIMYADSDD